MDFSVWPAPRGWLEILDTALLADKEDWHGVWLADHFMQSDDRSKPTVEVWSTLSGLAARTQRVRLGTLACSVTYRHPAVLAATASSADHVAGGRVVLGIGAGWQTNEHEAYGIELGTVQQRCDRLEEAALVIESLLHRDRTTADGEYFQLSDAPNEPKPRQSRLPLLVAGRGERRTMRTAARYADEWNGWCTADEMRAKRNVLARHAEPANRNVDSIRCSTQAFVCFSENPEAISEFRQRVADRPTLIGSPDRILEQVAEFADAGTDELIVPDWLIDDSSERSEHLERFRVEVIQPFSRR